MTKKSEAYIEEELLTALLDGELFGERAREVQRATLESSELKAQLVGLGSVSAQFRDVFKSELNAAWPDGQPDLWSNLERSLKQDLSAKPHLLPNFTLPNFALNFDLQSLFPAKRFAAIRIAFQRNFMPAMGAFAAAGLLVVVGMNYLGDKQIESSIVASNVHPDSIHSDSIHSDIADQEIPMRDLLSELSASRGKNAGSDQLVGQFGVGRSRPDSSSVHFVSSGPGVGRAELPGQLFSEQLIDPDKLSLVPETTVSKIEWINSDRPFKFVKCHRDKVSANPPVVWIGRND